MDFSRRGFLGCLAATSAWAGCSTNKLFTGGKGDYDPNFAVLLSDVHVCGTKGAPPHQYAGFVKAVGEILKMDPLPANVVIFGDLAYSNGHPQDYARSAPLIKQLEDAGIKVTIGMGNHDRRKNFLAQHPAYEKTTLVPGNIVSKVSVGSADLIMLDSLCENPDEKRGNQVAGELSAAQQEWLTANAATFTRPTFFCSHHPTKELKVKGKDFIGFLATVPGTAGHIYGHNHRWHKYWGLKSWKESKIFRTLCLPSTGHWGDIGYTLFRTNAKTAEATLVQYDFFFPKPLPEGTPQPDLWKKILAENQHQSCTFYFN